MGLCAIILLLWQLAVVSGTAQAEGNSLFFLHHSVGSGLVSDGIFRGRLAELNAELGTDFVFWDHSYNSSGLIDPAGIKTQYNFNIPDDNTDPDGLYFMWTTSNAAKDSILSRFDVIAFKSCYPNANIVSDYQLQQFKDYYLGMREVFDSYPEKKFVVMSPPPVHSNIATVANSARAREFANWMGSDEYLAGHPNIFFFDLFDKLAEGDESADSFNMLKHEYTRNLDNTDSHPNDLANLTVGPLLADFMVDVAREATTSAVPEAELAVRSVRNHPNPFNPSTEISFTLERPASVQVLVYDLRGRLVRDLFSADKDSGDHAVTWDGRGDGGTPVESGVYLVQVRTAQGARSLKVLLAK
jgi:hypothetical protein